MLHNKVDFAGSFLNAEKEHNAPELKSIIFNTTRECWFAGDENLLFKK